MLIKRQRISRIVLNSAMLSFCVSSSSIAAEFRILKSANHKFCQRIVEEANRFRKAGKEDAFVLPGLVGWSVIPDTRRLTGITYDGPIYYAEFDVDNDGKPDKVIKTKWWIGGGENSNVSIVPPMQSLDELLSDRKILAKFALSDPNRLDFEMGRWVDRHKAKYGDSDINLDWEFTGVSDIDAFVDSKTTYFVAQHIMDPEQGFLKAYVFKWLPDKTVEDVCMFARDRPTGSSEKH